MAPDRSDYCNGAVAQICLAALEIMVLVTSPSVLRAHRRITAGTLHGVAALARVSATPLGGRFGRYSAQALTHAGAIGWR